MKRIAWLLGVMIMVGGLNAQTTRIAFRIEGLEAGTCKLIGVLGTQNYLVETLESTGNGQLEYRSGVPLAQGLYFLLLPDGRTFVQFLAGESQNFELATRRSDLVGAMVVTGDLENELFYQNQRFESRFRHQFDSVKTAMDTTPPSSPNQAFLKNMEQRLLDSRKAHLDSFRQQHPEAFFTRFKLAGQNPELPMPKGPDGRLDTLQQVYLYRMAYWDNTPLDDEGLLRTPVIANKLKTFITDLTPQKADSVIKYADYVISQTGDCQECFKFVVNWIAIQYQKPKFSGGDAVFVHLVDKWFSGDQAFWFEPGSAELRKIRKLVDGMRPSLIGKTGQNLRCKDLNGDYQEVYAMESKLKIVYLYSYTCSHCRERSPVLAEVLREWGPKGLGVYALCLDPEEDRWRAFVDQYGMNDFINVLDPDFESQYYRKYHIDVTPELYILDENNTIISKDLAPDQIRPILEKYLE